MSLPCSAWHLEIFWLYLDFLEVFYDKKCLKVQEMKSDLVWCKLFCQQAVGCIGDGRANYFAVNYFAANYFAANYFVSRQLDV